MTDKVAEIVRYFQTRLPVMLDGAVWRGEDRGALLRRAGTALRTGKTPPNNLPMALLREILDAIPANVPAAPAPKTMAGAVPVGPRHARIWWDARVTDSLGDVLARIEDPKLVLRFYDVTGLDPEGERWHETFDIDVRLNDEGRTVQFWSGDRTYVVDLGYAHDGGRFLRLARTNAIDLPRDGKAASGTDGTATSRLCPAGDKQTAYVAPDAAAAAWARARPDHELRDWDAELVVHMLYRAFLREGPRALRRTPALARRGEETLRGEFAGRRRRRGAETKRAERDGPLFLVRRLDAPVSASLLMPAHAPAAPVAASRAEASAAPAFGAPGGADFAWHALFFRAVRASAEAPRVGAASSFAAMLPAPEAAALSVDAERVEDGHIRVAGADVPAAMFATPVFEAARSLRESLAGLQAIDMDGVADGWADDARVTAQVVPSAEALGAAQVFDASEAKRLAKAGVRVSRMSLTLEGRIRPGARLKVAGKLVHADAEGNFRLECVLSGRRTAIPMRAGTSISGEARSLISVDWSKRAGEKLAAAEA